MPDDDSLLARHGRTVSAGEVVFREGDVGDEMFVVQQGAVRITKGVRDGQKVLALLGPGEFFGEMAILNDKPRSATAEVVEDGRLLVLNAKTFESMVVRHSEIAVRLIKKLAGRLDAMDALVGILVHRDPRMRVILGLLRAADAHEVEQTQPVLRVPLSEEALAEQVGLGAGEVRDVIARLARLGLVEPEPAAGGSGAKAYVLRDRSRLEAFLAFVEQQVDPATSAR